MNTTDAEALISRIKESMETTGELITQAFREAIWLTLGYDSWDSLCSKEFCDLKMTRENRRALVPLLAKDGMSARAIASALQVGKSTISSDLDEAGITDRLTIGKDGKTRRPSVHRRDVARQTLRSTTPRNDVTKITITLNVEDYDLIKHLARSSGMTVTEYMIHASLAGKDNHAKT